MSGPADLPPACVPEEEGGRCSICGDEGLEAEVVEAPEDPGAGRVRISRRDGSAEERRVAFDLLPGVEAGDRVVVHMGFAIARLRGDGGGS